MSYCVIDRELIGEVHKRSCARKVPLVPQRAATKKRSDNARMRMYDNIFVHDNVCLHHDDVYLMYGNVCLKYDNVCLSHDNVYLVSRPYISVHLRIACV